MQLRPQRIRRLSDESEKWESFPCRQAGSPSLTFLFRSDDAGTFLVSCERDGERDGEKGVSRFGMALHLWSQQATGNNIKRVDRW